MRSTHSREQDFMAITAEVEVLHQQLKGKGMYTVPPAFPTTSDSKPSNNVHFQPIDPAQKSSVQTMDQSLLNSSLNLLDDSPQLQSSSSNRQIPCGQTTPQGSVHANNCHVPPTPYVNQTAVNQHMGMQPTQIPPRMSTGPTNLQPPTKTPPSQMPSDILPQQLPFVDTPLAPTQKTILLTIQIRHPHVTLGLKVQTGKALSRLHQHHLPPLHQWESQDLFVGTVEKQDT